MFLLSQESLKVLVLLVMHDFKGKKEMKSSVLKQYIDVHKLGPALITLKSLGHPTYQFIDINADFLNKELDMDDTSLNQSSELG